MRRREIRQAQPPTERHAAYERDFSAWLASFVGASTGVDQGTLRMLYANARRKDRERQRYRLRVEAKAVQRLEMPTMDEDLDEAPTLPSPPSPPRPWPLPRELTLHIMESCLHERAGWTDLACVCRSTSEVDKRALEAR